MIWFRFRLCVGWGSPSWVVGFFFCNPSRTKRSTSFLNISLCNLGTGCGLKNIGFTLSFNSKSTGSVFQVPSIPSNNSSKFCNYFSNSLRCTSVIFWGWFSIRLFKYAFSDLASKMTFKCLLEVHTCSD